ncbi:MAG TPA: M4 family metallopeptidase [Vicinamibacterales bacterium]|nr:M4 family metallopeptidase [Vicinamibacterales bacterium]
MTSDRTLRLRAVEADALVPGRQHERFDQFFRGIRIAGGDLTRQTAPDGTVSLFGTVHVGIALDTAPSFSVADAAQRIAVAGGGAVFGADPELVIAPLSDGYHLAYSGDVFTGLQAVHVVIDAKSGDVLQTYSAFTNDVGIGTGTYGDTKKVSSTSNAGDFIADDKLRPAEITTYDAAGSLDRATALLAGITPSINDIASSTNDVWTDPTVVDAHVYAGWYYDYLFKRFSRHGLDNHDLRIAILTHPVRLSDIATAPLSVLGLYYLNSFFCAACGPNGRGEVLFGEGAPASYAGIEVKPFSAAFDVVAHELTHGVTAASANLNGFPYSEAASLNEGFSDIFGVSTVFFYEPAGNGVLHASYLQGKDLTNPPGAFVPLFGGTLARSMSNPQSTGDPDHYTQRVIGGDPHYNSTILSHAFYLAIEGGVNRTSGLAVQGVGAANRDQIEKSFFRALTMLLPSNATFALTRVATVQAARDLYGAGSAVERAITQAWDAVGVQERTVPTAAGFAAPSAGSCTAAFPWLLSITASAGNANMTLNQMRFDYFDANGTALNSDTFNAAQIAANFRQCGPGSARVLAQADICARVCVNVAPATSGSVSAAFMAVDDSNHPLTFSMPNVVLH